MEETMDEERKYTDPLALSEAPQSVDQEDPAVLQDGMVLSAQGCNEPRYSPLIFSRYFCAVFSGCLPVLVPTVRHVSVGRDRILVGVGKLRIPGE
jgi:hypothetical protein